MATSLGPLHAQLLKKGVQWAGTRKFQQAYEACKQNLISDTLLMHYDGNRELRLACDASSYGLGEFIGHVLDNGRERLIAVASRTLSSSERNYAQIEREA